MAKIIENGTIFGDLIVIKHIGSVKQANVYLCKCNCGNLREVRATDLLRNYTNNCGCKNFIYKKHGNSKYEPRESSFRAKAANYKCHALKRNIDFDISYEYAVKLLSSNCFYCGSPPSNRYNVRNRNREKSKNGIGYAKSNSDGYDIYYNGIDRVDNTKGYVYGNVVSCCTKCNTAKLNYTLDEFKEWIRLLYNNLNNI